MKQIKTFFTISLILVVASGLLFASGDKPASGIERVDQIVIYSNQMMDPDESQNNSVGGTTRYGTKDSPGAEYIVRWCTNGGTGVGAENFMNISNAAAAKGAYGMELGMGEIPSNNCWLDIHRDGAAEGWDVPLDASGTEQVSFWVKADAGTAPFWFIAQSWADADNGATEKQYAVSAFVDGETVLMVDDFGEVQVLRDNPFDGEWQQVVIPWAFLKMTDQAAVEALLPWSSVWEGSADDTEAGFAFDEGLMRTIKWHTKPEGDQATIDAYGASAESKWGDLGDLLDTPGTWMIDEVIFGRRNIEQSSVSIIDIWRNEMMDPDESQNNSIGGTTRYGTKSEPGAENIVRWCTNGGTGVGAENYMEISSADVADGPYAMKLGMGEIPSNNCWMDMHRDGAIEGWDVPLDASGTGRVTFWLKADVGTAPFWFIAQSWADADNGAAEKQYAVSAFVDGETVLYIDDFGDVQVLRDNPFDGEWQFVSIPWQFLKMTDQAAVEALLPWSSVWEGSADDTEAGFAFDEGLMRTIKWHTKPEGDQATVDAYGASAESKWGDLGDLLDTPGEWIIDEVRFLPPFDASGYKKEIKLYTNEMMDPDESQNNSVGGTTRYGTKSEPGAENIVRWCTNGGTGVGAENYMEISSADVADGPYAMKLGMGEIPSNNCWMDIHRDGAAEGWDIPLDASETDRVTFWLKADAGTAPFWFIAQSWADADNGAAEKQYAVSAFVDGETVLMVDEFGDVQVLRDNPFDGEWQFVSIPWKFLKMTDQAAVEALLPWSSVWEGSADDTEAGFAFDEGLMRTIKWHTKPEGDQATVDAYGASAESKWGDLGDLLDTPGEWIIDEVVLTSAYEDGYDGVVGVKEEIVALPNTYKLGNAYPNPFNPTTNIKFAIPVSNNVKIDVYNIMGQKVRTLVNTEMNAGSYEVTWDAKNDNGAQVSTGIYFFHMKSSHFQATQKAILMK